MARQWQKSGAFVLENEDGREWQGSDTFLLENTAAAATTDTFFYRRVPRTRKPSHYVPIDKCNPLNRGLVTAFYGCSANRTYEEKGLIKQPSLVGTAYYNSEGIYIPSDGLFRLSDVSTLLTDSRKLTVTVVFNRSGNSLPSFARLIVMGATTAYRVARSSTSNTAVLYNKGGSTTITSHKSLFSAYSNTALTITYDGDFSSGVINQYSDGVHDGSLAWTNLSTDYASTLTIGNDSTLTYGIESTVLGVFVHDRVLSEAEAISISANPWQLLAPINEPLFISTAAAAASTASPLRFGSFSLLGMGI